MSAEFTDFRKEAHHHGYVLLFSLKWRIDCTAGSEPSCQGLVDVPPPEGLPDNLHLRYPPLSNSVLPYANGKGIVVHCHPRKGKCEDTTGEQNFELIGRPELRAGLEMIFKLELRCITGNTDNHKTTLTVKFDGQGQLDHRHSHLGTLS